MCLVEKLLDALAREDLVHAGGLAALQQAALGLGVAAVVDALQPLALADGQDGGARLEGVDKLAHEVELAGLLAFLAGLGRIFVHRKNHTLVVVVAIVVAAAGVVGIAAGDDLLHEVHGGIAAPLVTFAPGADKHLVQGDGGRSQADVQRAALSRADRQQPRVITDVRDLQHPGFRGRRQDVAAIQVCLRAVRRPFPHHRGIRQRLAGDGVGHRAAQHRPLGEGRHDACQAQDKQENSSFQHRQSLSFYQSTVFHTD